MQFDNMKNKKPRIGMIVLSLLLACLVQTARSQESLYNLSLDNAIDLSVKNSKQLKSSRARIDEATAVLHQAKDQQLPDFKLSGSYLYLSSPTVDLKTGSGLDTGAGKKIQVSQAVYGMANLSLPVFSGFKIQYGIESAKYLEQAARLDADHDREGVILNAINAYINLYKSKAAVLLVQQNLQESKQRDNDFASLEKNGVLARNDLLKAKLETSNIELSLLDAENNWKLASVNMNLLLGLPEKTQFALDTTSFKSAGTVQGIDEYENMARQNRNDIKALEARQKAAGAGIKSAKGDYFPSVALTTGYVAADIPGFLSITNAVTAGVGVSYNLSSLWKTRAKIDQAKAREAQIIANEGVLDDQIHYQINEAYEGYLLTQKKIDVYIEAIDQALENYKISKNKFDNNLLTTTDLLDADLAQLRARLNYAFAKADAVAAYNKLMLASGLINTLYTTKQ